MAIEGLIEFTRGEAVQFPVTIVDDDDVDRDISSWEHATMTIRLRKQPHTVVLTLDETNSVTFDSPDIVVTLTAAQTVELDQERYVFDIWRMDENAEAVVAFGPLIVRPSVREVDEGS